MGRDQKILLPTGHPLWKAAREGAKAQQKGAEDVAAQRALDLADQVTDMLDTGGEIELKDQSGALVKVRIKGLHEF